MREEPMPGGGFQVDTRGRLLRAVTGSAAPGSEGKIGCTKAPPSPRE